MPSVLSSNTERVGASSESVSVFVIPTIADGALQSSAKVSPLVKNIVFSKSKLLLSKGSSVTKYRIIAETAPDGIVTINDANKIIFVNPSAINIFGYLQSDRHSKRMVITYMLYCALILPIVTTLCFMLLHLIVGDMFQIYG